MRRTCFFKKKKKKDISWETKYFMWNKVFLVKQSISCGTKYFMWNKVLHIKQSISHEQKRNLKKKNISLKKIGKKMKQSISHENKAFHFKTKYSKKIEVFRKKELLIVSLTWSIRQRALLNHINPCSVRHKLRFCSLRPMRTASIVR
jgi:hypothetical protein